MRNVNTYNIRNSFTEHCFLYFIDRISMLENVCKYFIINSGKFSMIGAEKKDNRCALLYQRHSPETCKRRRKRLKMVGKGYIDKNRTFYEGNGTYKH